MTIQSIKMTGSLRAVVIFAGWAMDARPFASLHKDGYDLYVAYDYRTAEADTALLDRYDEICIVAWSWGVPAAARFIHRHSELPVTAAIAVNGTMTPIDDTCGIPERIFQGTLDGLTESSLAKFYRRVCGSASLYRRFAEGAPMRDFASLRPELEAIRDNGASPLSPLIFDRVMISDADLVIPSDNQRHAWKGHPCVMETEGAHLPDFQRILDLYVRDKSLIGERFAAASATYPQEANVQRHIARRLASLWRSHDSREAVSILELGTGCGFMTEHYIKAPWCRRATLVDLYPSIDGVEVGDAETYPLASGEWDTVIAASAMQWFNSIRRFLQRAADALPSGGIMALSGFGERHFHELRGMIPNSLYYYSTEEFTSIVPDGLRIVAAEDETVTITFTDMRDMLDHLRLTGVNGITSRQTVGITRRILAEMSASDSLTLTYHPTYFILRKI